MGSASADDSDDYDATLSALIGCTPLLKTLRALRAIQGLHIARNLLLRYDTFLGEVAKPEVRAELDGLDYSQRNRSTTYQRLRQNAQDFQKAAARVWRALHGHARYQDHLERYVVL